MNPGQDQARSLRRFFGGKLVKFVKANDLTASATALSAQCRLNNKALAPIASVNRVSAVCHVVTVL